MRRYQKPNVYTKLRKNFGRQPLFQTVPGHILDTINPNVALQKEYMLRNPVNKEVQVNLPRSEHEVNTIHVEMTDQGINHTEGGWPRDVHLYNEEHITRHRRRVQHEDNYVHTVVSLQSHFEHNIQQNNAIEMYESYFANIKPQPAVEKYNIQIGNTFRDPYERPVASIAWTTEKKSKLVASYCEKLYPSDNKDNAKTTCYMWDINKETKPFYEFDPEHCCWDIACSPAEPEIIITGLDIGIVKLFDVRAGKRDISSSSIYNSHRAPVSSVLYTVTRTNTEFFTGSPDGQCLWWDTRKLSQPVDQLPMSVKLGANDIPSFENSEGVSCLEYDRGLPTKFLAGTESGLIINANRMGRSHSEILSSYWEAHNGPVRAVQRSPCTLRMFISCGDFTVRIWSEEVRCAPIVVTKPYRYQVTDVSWAPMRYSSYMVASEDGMFYYWDLLRKYREPVATLQVSKTGLNKITPHPMGKSIAVGDNKGCLYLLNLPENMIFPGPSDKLHTQETYHRETKREHILDMRVKELKLKTRVEAENVVAAPEEDEEAVLDEETDRYFNIVKEEMRQICGGNFSLNSESSIDYQQ